MLCICKGWIWGHFLWPRGITQDTLEGNQTSRSGVLKWGRRKQANPKTEILTVHLMLQDFFFN